MSNSIVLAYATYNNYSFFYLLQLFEIRRSHNSPIRKLKAQVEESSNRLEPTTSTSI